MDLREQIGNDVKDAMRAKDSLRLTALRFLQAAVKNREIEMRPNPITPEDVQGVIRKLVKQRKESIEQYTAAKRQDLVDPETAELKILEAYLPKALGKEELIKIVEQVIAETGAKSRKEMGVVMKAAMAKAEGAADSRTLSEIIQSKLAP